MYLERAGRRPSTSEVATAQRCASGNYGSVDAEKGKAAMFEDDDDARIEAAMLARGDRRWAAEAFRSIAVDESVGEDVRLEAARELAELSEQSAGLP
jgi:hypothetical protein